MRRCSTALTLTTLLWLAGCGRTDSDEPEPEPDVAELAPHETCTAAYESLPPETPPRALPTVYELELCNGRDTRAWAIEVTAGRAVTITLENPASVDTFRLGVHRYDVDDYEPLPVTAGTTQAELGRLAERSFSFTPEQSGAVSLYASSGMSRGEPSRLRIDE